VPTQNVQSSGLEAYPSIRSSYHQRLPRRGAFYGSAVMAEGRLYAVSKMRGTVVLAAGKEFKQLARNDLGDRSLFNATPVISDGCLLLRSDRFLYCIGK